MGPGQYFYAPPALMHSFQRSVEPGAFVVAGTIARKNCYDARVTVIIQGIFQHSQLQYPVGHLLFSPLRTTPIIQMYL